MNRLRGGMGWPGRGLAGVVWVQDQPTPVNEAKWARSSYRNKQYVDFTLRARLL
jgi:hypothetical protein